MGKACAALLLLSLASFALGEVDFKRLPNDLNHFLDSKTLTPKLEKTINLLRQKRSLKTASKGLDMNLMDGKSEEHISKVNILNTIFEQ
jgi:hypothetical protein